MNKTILLSGILFLLSCSTRKTVSNSAILQEHAKPIRIFNIGYWPHKRYVLTLVDAKSNYFVIVEKADTTLKAGDIYFR